MRLLVVCCVLAGQATQLRAQMEPQMSPAEVYAKEGLGALGGTACAASCGGAALGVAYLCGLGLAFNQEYGSDPGDWAVFEAALCVAGVCAAVLPAAAAYGTIRAGEDIGAYGSGDWAYGGAYAGLPLAVGAFALGIYVGNSPGQYGHSHWDIPIFVLGGLAIPVGAVVGYNLGVKREAPPSYFGGRFDVPRLAMTFRQCPDRTTEYGLNIRLVGVRF
jgi:hypothetical protein